MIFYKYIFFQSLTFIILTEIVSENPHLNFETVFEAPVPASIGLQFNIKINNTSETDYDIEVRPDECCLEDDNGLDCDCLKVLDEYKCSISNGSTKSLKIVTPLLDLYNRKGHCVIYVDTRSNTSKVKRNSLTLTFDTKSNAGRNLPKNFKVCKSQDEDPQNNCQPVDCDSYYNGERSYYSRKRKRCLPVPYCVHEGDSVTPNVIYSPITNKCIAEALLKEDVRYIKSLSKTGDEIEKNRQAKEILIITKHNPNATDFIEGMDFIDDLETTTRKHSKSTHQTPSPKSKTTKLSDTTNKIQKNIQTPRKPDLNSNCITRILKKYLTDNRWTFIILGLVVTIQCFLICTMFYCLSKTCNCFKDKKVVRKFFNNRHDASVTTPLIGTSNMDTEMDYQYVTDSSKVDQKIQCYKACQKDINNEMKMSMSDDILSKCLNRRDWKKLSKSEAVTKEGEIAQKILEEIKNNHKPIPEDAKKVCETRVVFEDEIKKNDKAKVSAVKSATIVEGKDGNKDVRDSASSEKEIKCHSYDDDSNMTGFTPIQEAGCFKSEQSKRGTRSLSTEKGAQASFENDSIDDLLSKRGVIYLAGENISKYTFHSNSCEIKPSNASSISSKTSKNFLKNVPFLFRKKSKQGPSSDPGRNKEVNLELLHMSKATVYTSSNDSDCAKTFKRKDSRTSF